MHLGGERSQEITYICSNYIYIYIYDKTKIDSKVKVFGIGPEGYLRFCGQI